MSQTTDGRKPVAYARP